VLVFFFSVTGLTLNHADRFGDRVRTVQEKGRMDTGWTNVKDSAKIDRLDIVETIRNRHGVHAAMSDFRVDDAQIGVSFKGPGYAADVFIDRATGNYDITKTSAGFVGLINDLHKGRDTGHGWSVFIDVAAILMTLVSLTGMLLLLFLKRRRRSGFIVAVAGLFIAYLVYVIWIK
jgi:hypothetical protein